MKKYAKETYMNNYEDLILNQSCGSKTFWQLMGILVDKQSKLSNIPPLETPNDSYVYTDVEKANLLNSYFCSISSIDDSNVNLPDFNKRTQSTLSDLHWYLFNAFDMAPDWVQTCNIPIPKLMQNLDRTGYRRCASIWRTCYQPNNFLRVSRLPIAQHK